MSTKDEVLAILENLGEKTVSGQWIASELGISRTAVWKAINNLKEEGYQIGSSTNAGYRLLQETDSLNAAAIRPLIKNKVTIEALPMIDSTNAEAKRRLNENPNEDLLILAEAQEKGRGRLGRVFHSPAQTGIYMSLVLHDLDPKMDATLITTAAAVAVCQAIENLTDLNPKIKWVNDIFIDGRKVCGILTEGILSLETQTIQSIILGIGINVTKDPQLPEELEAIVGAVFERKSTVSRNRLAAEIINQFYEIYKTMETKGYLDEYRRRCFVLGEKVTFVRNGEPFEGLATGIDDTGALEIRLSDGSETSISYGEISIKLEGK